MKKNEAKKLEDAIREIMLKQTNKEGQLIIGDPPCHIIDLEECVQKEWTQEVIDEMKLFLSWGINKQDDVVYDLAEIRRIADVSSVRRVPIGYETEIVRKYDEAIR